MNRVVTPAQAAKLDEYLINTLYIPGVELMHRAACGLLDAALDLLPASRRVVCVCGKGNNGGDGIALACLLYERGIHIRIVLLSDAEKLPPDAAHYFNKALELGIEFSTEPCKFHDELIIDAIFGVGLSRAVSGIYADAIRRINESGLPVLSADLPSGLSGYNGSVLGLCVKADRTVTFGFMKSGLLLGKGREYSGRVTVHPLTDEELPLPDGIPLYEFSAEDATRLLPKRKPDSSKWQNGRVLLCVGSERYRGAALLSIKACLRGGCGLLFVATPAPVAETLTGVIPEAIALPLVSNEWDEAAMNTALGAAKDKDVVGIGSGMGSCDVEALLEGLLRMRCPLVIDADALRCLANHDELKALLHEGVVLTPHLREMSALDNKNANEILLDPVACAFGFSKKYGCTVLLKGHTSCISNGTQVVFNTSGNPGLAKGGSGDVLTGICCAMIAQGLAPFDAACCAAYLLGATADKALELLSERMLLASDITEVIESEIVHGR